MRENKSRLLNPEVEGIFDGNIKSGSLMASIFGIKDIGVSVTNEEGKYLEVNDTYCKIFGYSRDDLSDTSYLSVLSPESRADFILSQDRIKDGIFTSNCKGLKKDGTKIDLTVTQSVVYDKNGNYFRVSSVKNLSAENHDKLVQSVLLDISQEAGYTKSSEDIFKLIHKSVGQLMPVKNFYIAIYDADTDTISFPYLVDEIDDDDDVIVDAKSSLGLTAYQLRKGCASLIKEEEILNMIDSGEMIQLGPMSKVWLGGTLKVQNKPIGVMALQSYDDENAYSEEEKAIIELISDQVARVIERNMFEKALIDAKEEAEKANRVKSDFLAQISHEIRTPINSILSFSSLLRSELEDLVSEELKESFELIDRGGKRLIRTVDLLLNVAQAQSGKRKIHPCEVDLQVDILNPIVVQLKYMAEEKGLSIDLICSSQYTVAVCDAYTVNQIFINLIDNAIKYSFEGRIVVQIFNNQYGQLQVDIRDNGIGIAEDYLPNMFEIFTQEETGYTRRFEGNGLGLALVKEYANLNNIKIEVKSQKGKGSTFSVIFV